MAIDRYSKDYRLTDSVDARGRIHTETEYIGQHYVFGTGQEKARAAGKKLAVLCALAWLGFLAALYPSSLAGRTLYASLPCAFSALPLWLLSTVAVTALRVREPFVHRDADRFNLRLPSAAVFTCVFAAAAVLGGILALVLAESAVSMEDGVFLAGNLLCFGCALLCRKQQAALTAHSK